MIMIMISTIEVVREGCVWFEAVHQQLEHNLLMLLKDLFNANAC